MGVITLSPSIVTATTLQDLARQAVVAVVSLTPVAGSATNVVVVVTDFAQTGGRRVGFDPVMYIGVDTLGLVAVLPQQQIKVSTDCEASTS